MGFVLVILSHGKGWGVDAWEALHFIRIASSQFGQMRFY